MESQPLIVVADDSAMEQAVITESLVNWGYRIVTCQTGVEAVEKTAEYPTVVLLDGMMPDMDGYAACKQIKLKYPAMPVIIMTAYDNAKALEQAFAAGADDYLAKPIYWPLLKLRLQRIVERQELQAELSRREMHLKYVLEAGTEGYWDAKWENDRSNMNLTMMRPIFPVMAEQTCIEALVDNIHPDDKERVLTDARAFLSGQGDDYLAQDFRVRVNSGEWRWLFSKGRILERDSDTGTPIRAGGVISDVHQHKMMERQLAEAQILGRTGSWSLETGEREFSVSPGFCRLLDIPIGTVRFDIHRLLEKVHPHDREALAVMYSQFWKHQDLVRFEFHTAEDHDAAKLLQGEARVVLDTSGRPVRLVGTLVDITERRRLETLMRDNLRRLNQFVEAVSDISFILDETGQYVQAFGQKSELLLAPPTELLGKNIKDVLPPGVADLLFKTLKKALDTGKQQEIEYELLVAPGYRRFGGKVVPMQYSQDGRQSVALLLVDITSKHRTEEALRLSYERRRRNDYFNDLTAGRQPSAGSAELIHGDTFDETRFYSFSLLIIDSWRGESLADWLAKRRMQLQYAIDELIDRLSKTDGQIAWDAGEGKIGLIVLRADKNYFSDEGFSAWLKIMEARFAGIRLRAGIAPYGNKEPLSQRYMEALQAITVGTKIWPERNCYAYSELGVFQILMQVGHKEITERFVRQSLGALLDYDRQKGAELVDTLDAILAYPNLREAADKLFIHYKTLLFRRKRIEELLDLSLEEAENRVSLSVAIRMWRLIKP